MGSRVAVVGGGIVGLAFAWEAARRGHRVALLDRTDRAVGASVRNFGMIWPIGQPPGPAHARALRSRERWLELRAAGAVAARECGSLHVAHHDDEDAVLREYVALADRVACEYLDPAAAVRRFPAVNPNGLRAALFSPTELVVDPPAAVAGITRYLVERHGVVHYPGTTVVGVERNAVRTSAREMVMADRVFVCAGADFESLFPATFAAAGLRRCKLQMMRTAPQPGGWALGPHVAGGLTLTHYKAFAACPSVAALKARFAAELPEHVRYGIHVMAAQNDRGEVVIGDSHEYDADISPFDKPEIDRHILDYLAGLVRLPDPTIAARWHGVYAKHPDEPVVFARPQPNCVCVMAVGGAGMTLSFGLAADWWDEHG